MDICLRKEYKTINYQYVKIDDELMEWLRARLEDDFDENIAPTYFGDDAEEKKELGRQRWCSLTEDEVVDMVNLVKRGERTNIIIDSIKEYIEDDYPVRGYTDYEDASEELYID